MLKETKGTFDRARTQDIHITSQTYNPLCPAAPCTIMFIIKAKVVGSVKVTVVEHSQKIINTAILKYFINFLTILSSFSCVYNKKLLCFKTTFIYTMYNVVFNSKESAKDPILFVFYCNQVFDWETVFTLELSDVHNIHYFSLVYLYIFCTKDGLH